jgi:hypothetical protein
VCVVGESRGSLASVYTAGVIVSVVIFYDRLAFLVAPEGLDGLQIPQVHKRGFGRISIITHVASRSLEQPNLTLEDMGLAFRSAVWSKAAKSR